MKTVSTILFLLISNILMAQEAVEKFSFHAQTTIINQFKPAYNAKYSGTNSLSPEKESATSITSTLYLGARLWRGAEMYFNPELAGGAGISSVLGLGDATNGETFRIGDHAPKIYVARLFIRQTFALSNEKIKVDADLNQLAGTDPSQYIRFTIGKLGLADIFDDNQFSHDPRTQFMCWGLMANGAWDYAANTRGYAPSAVIEYVTPKNEWRYVVSMLPTYANGPIMNRNLSQAKSQTAEYTRRYKFQNKNGAIRMLAFYSNGFMGNYNAAVALQPVNPDIETVRKLGGRKYGFGLNMEQEFTRDLGGFARSSWNDGRDEIWAFTQIDRTISAGLSLKGTSWKRNQDRLGLAQVISGLSKPHQAYLKAGGTDFMLGDGNLNYKPEKLTEIYYSAPIQNTKMTFSGAYQFILNPGYNADRKGPVHVFSLRLHTEI